MTNQPSTTSKNIPSINGIKGICAFVVAFIWHYQHFAPLSSPMYQIFKPFYDYGHLAVVIFFMLSGLGMSIGYESKIRSSKITFSSFMFGRIQKIYPIMFLSTVATTLLQISYRFFTGNIFQYPIEYFDIYHFFLNILGLQYGFFCEDFSFNAPSWFISILLICYITFYVVNVLAKKHPKLLIGLYSICIALGYTLLLPCKTFHILLNSSVGYGLACFFSGCILSRLYLSSRNILTTVLGYISLLTLLLTTIMLYTGHYLPFINAKLYAMIIYSPMLIIAIFFVPWFQAALSLYPLIKLGELSIYIYLWHFPVQIMWAIASQMLTKHIAYENVLTWFLYTASVLLFSKVCHLLKLRFNSTIHSSKG